MKKVPCWLPDWKDPAQYPDHGDDFNLWAWEFLRRNPEYQADWDSLNIGHTEVSASSNEQSFELDARLISPVPGHSSPLETKARRLGRKWGLFHGPIEDPAHSRPIGTFGPRCSPSTTVLAREDILEDLKNGESLEDILDGICSGTRVLVSVDLAQSIKPQLDSARKDLGARQKEKLRKGQVVGKKGRARDAGKYVRYLRALDAETVGVDESTIAKELLPHMLVPQKGKSRKFLEKRAREAIQDSLKAAKALASEGYLNLLPLPTGNQ